MRRGRRAMPPRTPTTTPKSPYFEVVAVVAVVAPPPLSPTTTPKLLCFGKVGETFPLDSSKFLQIVIRPVNIPAS